MLGDEVFSRLGLRVIALDRPGVGQPAFQPKRGFSDWVKDVEPLTDELGLDKFSVLGISEVVAMLLSVLQKFLNDYAQW